MYTLYAPPNNDSLLLSVVVMQVQGDVEFLRFDSSMRALVIDALWVRRSQSLWTCGHEVWETNMRGLTCVVNITYQYLVLLTWNAKFKSQETLINKQLREWNQRKREKVIQWQITDSGFSHCDMWFDMAMWDWDCANLHSLGQRQLRQTR